MAKQNTNTSALVETVNELDISFAELNRLGSRIKNMELESDTDFEQAQHLLQRFAECAQGVSSGVVAMSEALNQARVQAETVAQMVSARALELQNQKGVREQKMEAFRTLGGKVFALNSSLNDLKRPEGQQLTANDRNKISMRLAELELQLQPLIEEAHNLKTDAQKSNMSVLEQSAHSLEQSLTALSHKLSSLHKDADQLQ